MTRTERRDEYVIGKRFEQLSDEERQEERFRCICGGTGLNGYRLRAISENASAEDIVVGKACLSHCLDSTNA